MLQTQEVHPTRGAEASAAEEGTETPAPLGTGTEGGTEVGAIATENGPVDTAANATAVSSNSLQAAARITEAGTGSNETVARTTSRLRLRGILVARGSIRTLCNVLTLDFISVEEIREALRFLREADLPEDPAPTAHQDQNRRLRAYLGVMLEIRRKGDWPSQP